MANHFDPYQAWLGIALEGPPPDHYQLLGLHPFESDPRTITVKAEARMDRVKPFLEGIHAQTARRLLDEILAARNCLLRPETKTGYDKRLRSECEAVPAEVRPRPQADARVDQRQPAFVEGAGKEAEDPLARRVKQQRSRPFWRSQSAQIVLGGIGGVLIAVPLVVLLHSGGGESEPSPRAAAPQRPADGRRPQVAEPRPSAAIPGKKPRLATEEPPEEPASPADAPVAPEPAPAEAVTSNAESAVGLDGQEAAGEVVAAAAGDLPPGQAEVPGAAAAKLPPSKPESAVVPSQPGPPGTKRPVPDQADQKEAEQRVRKLLGEEFAAARSREQAQSLARRLIQLGTDAKDDPTLRYVLFRMAEEGAIGAGDLSLALDAVDKAAADYDVDVWARKVDVLAAVIDAVRQARGAVPFGEATVEAAVALGDQAAAADKYEAARRIAEILLTAVRRAKNAQLARQLAGWEQEIERLESGFAAFREAQAVLAGDAAKADANLTAGRWLGFVKGNWEQALPLLAKGSDPLLAELARQDLAGPSDPESQISLAGGWRRQSLQETGPARSTAARRAVHWYDQALPAVAGLPQLEAAKSRFEALAIVGDPNADNVQGALEEGNVALAGNGARVTGSRTIQGAQYLLDGLHPGNAWAPCPCEWTITLSKVYRLQEIRIYLYSTSSFSYYFAVAVSTDGRNFSPLAERVSDPDNECQRLTFPARPVKAVKLRGVASTYTEGMLVAREFEAYCVPLDLAGKP